MIGTHFSFRVKPHTRGKTSAAAMKGHVVNGIQLSIKALVG